MTTFKTFACATLFALAAGSAMAQTAGGGASGGDGGGGGSFGYDAPIAAIQVPGIPQARPDMQDGSVMTCRYELLRGRFCETVPVR